MKDAPFNSENTETPLQKTEILSFNILACILHQFVTEIGVGSFKVKTLKDVTAALNLKSPVRRWITSRT